MPKKPKKTKAKVKPARPARPAKKVKKAKPVLVWKRSKRGRPKKQEARGKKQEKNGKRPSHHRTIEPSHHRTIEPSNHRTIEPLNQNGGEFAAEQSKFQLGPKQNAGDFLAHNIPLDYGKNRIVLLVVDPKFVFVYWEVQNDRMHEAISSIGHNAKLTLRFRNTDTDFTWDVSIYERVGNWYLKLDHPEQNLTVEIGMKNERGDFYTIARSNQMRLPRTGLAPKGPIRWMLVSPAGEKVITEIEEYTDADLELLKKILGPYFFDLLRRGKFSAVAGSSAENIFTEIQEIQPPSLSS